MSVQKRPRYLIASLEKIPDSLKQIYLRKIDFKVASYSTFLQARQQDFFKELNSEELEKLNNELECVSKYVSFALNWIKLQKNIVDHLLKINIL